MENIELLGFAAGLLVAISTLPQLLKSWKTKSTRDIAMLWLLINMGGQFLWIWYGFSKDSISLVVMAIITLFMMGSILLLKFKYR